MAIELDGGCRVFGLREGEPLRRGGLSVWRHVGREKGARAISLSTLELDPRASACWRNGGGDEALFVANGQGHVLVGGERHFVGPRTGVFVRPDEVVAIDASGTEPLTLLHSRCPDSGSGFVFEEPPPDFSGKAAFRAPSPVVRFEDQPTERAGV